MTRKPIMKATENGMALVLVAGLMVVFLLFAGLAIDAGRAFIVKAQLTKAVDGAALSAARALGSTSSSNPEKDEAIRIFRANFPSGYMGVSSVTNPATDPNFFRKDYDAQTGSNIITIRAAATLPMTFMRLANFQEITVSGGGQAKRRLVDLSIAIDCSGSISGDWTSVRNAARRFINSFDGNYDRLSVTLFSDGAHVSYLMPSSRGFNKTQAMNAVPTSLPGGSTSMAEGLYRAWDELRSVPVASQAGLRVLVLFTDGTPNGVSGNFAWTAKPGAGTVYTGKSLNTNDFPDIGPYGSNQPSFFGLSNLDCTTDAPNCFQYPYTHGTRPLISSTGQVQSSRWDSPTALPAIQRLPATSTHANHRSSGIPTTFPLQTNTLTVDGVAQSTARGLRTVSGYYPTDIRNLNNAARNLVEIIANAARSENIPAPANPPPYPIRIYTIGMGSILNYDLGARGETSASILKRIANDPDQAPLDHISMQMEGKYYWAQTAADVDAVFMALRSEIIRLSQ